MRCRLAPCRFALLLLTLLTLLVLAPAALAQVPATPTHVGATAADTQVTTTWIPVAGATSYNIYRSRTSGGEGTIPYTTGLTNPDLVVALMRLVDNIKFTCYRFDRASRTLGSEA